MIMRFPLLCPGPGYWLVSRRVVPPPQSDHWKQLLSGECTPPVRHKKGHHNLIQRNIHKQITKLWYVSSELKIRLGRNLYKVRSASVSISYIELGFDRCSFVQEELHNQNMTFLSGNMESGSSMLFIKTGTRKSVPSAHTFSAIMNRCMQLICVCNEANTYIVYIYL